MVSSPSHSSWTLHELGDLSEVAHQLYQMIRSHDRLSIASVATRQEHLSTAYQKVKDLLSKVDHQDFMSVYGQRAHELKQSLTQLHQVLSLLQEQVKFNKNSILSDQALREGYERYRQVIHSLLGEKATPPPARPTNLKRSIFHIFWGLLAVYLAEYFFEPPTLWWIAASFASCAWSLEIGRRLPIHRGKMIAQRLYQQLFGSIMHAQEATSISSGTWYATAVLFVATFFPKTILILAVLTLAVGDPIAGLIGRRFGRHKLTHNRTYEGTIAFVISATLSAYLLLWGLHSELSSPWILAFFVAVGGAFGELLSGHRFDDNLTVPIGAALGGALALNYLVIS